MRYIGSKERLLDFIDDAVSATGIHGGTFCDPFAGTGAVARHMKSGGWRVISGDLMYFSYVIQQATIVTNRPPQFTTLLNHLAHHQATEGGAFSIHNSQFIIHPESLPLTFEDPTSPRGRVLAHLDTLPPVHGFCYRHYAPSGAASDGPERRYFSPRNAARIDAMREAVELWQSAGLLDRDEYYTLVAAVVLGVPFVSNISGTYGAYLKDWDPRAWRHYRPEPPEFIPSDLTHESYCEDAGDLAARTPCDVLYLDPPYNEREYAANYHVLETVARWDSPDLRGKTGLRPDQHQRSPFCKRGGVAEALRRIVQDACCRHLLLSYNSEGLLDDASIRAILGERGAVVRHERPYPRFRSDRAPSGSRHAGDVVFERIYWLKMEG